LPLQKSAPCGWLHCAWQPPVTCDSQFAYPCDWHWIWQLMFACAWQLPWHAAWQVTGVHCAGCPWQLTLHCAPHVSLHDASHCVWFALLWQLPEQLASQSALHDPSQLKLGAVHPPWQLLSHCVVQLALIDAVHWPLQLASSCAEHCTSTLTGVHCAVHPPDVSTVQVSSPEKSMLPHDAMTVARALPGAKATRAPAMDAATAAKNDERADMEGLLP
jgi:hypothetical protein